MEPPRQVNHRGSVTGTAFFGAALALLVGFCLYMYGVLPGGEDAAVKWSVPAIFPSARRLRLARWPKRPLGALLGRIGFVRWPCLRLTWSLHWQCWYMHWQRSGHQAGR